ncbi:MAG: hypothetical protein M3464_14200 [Chloroflexota bacterium]|nr:hypothetical protein [Chloroflexota bacterium]
MSYAQKMISTNPTVPPVDQAVLAECIQACVDCAQACTACADACRRCEAACIHLLGQVPA